LLDEHLAPEIARQLRTRGHDVVAVAKRRELLGRADRVHFAASPEERRAIVTVDVQDFRPLLASAMRHGARIYGLICLPRRFPLGRAHLGRVVRALDAFLRAHPGDDDLVERGGEAWLQDH
jgi:hypothetical protein